MSDFERLNFVKSLINNLSFRARVIYAPVDENYARIISALDQLNIAHWDNNTMVYLTEKLQEPQMPTNNTRSEKWTNLYAAIKEIPLLTDPGQTGGGRRSRVQSRTR